MTTEVSDNTSQQMVFINGENKDWVDVELEHVWEDDNGLSACPTHAGMSVTLRPNSQDIDRHRYLND